MKLENKIPVNDLITDCPTCKNPTHHKYAGRMATKDNQVILIYQCLDCLGHYSIKREICLGEGK